MFTNVRLLTVGVFLAGATATVLGQSPPPLPLVPTPLSLTPTLVVQPAPAVQTAPIVQPAAATQAVVSSPSAASAPPKIQTAQAAPLPPPTPYIAPPPGPNPVYFPGGAPPGRATIVEPASVYPTLYFTTDLYFLQPTVKGTLRGNQTQPDGSVYTYTSPNANYGLAVSPRFEFGWRLPEDWGGFALDYRFLSARATADTADAFGPLYAYNRLTMDIFNFDYVSRRFAPFSRSSFQYRAGVRIEQIFYKNQATDGMGFSELAQNTFTGAGPHLGFEFNRELAVVPGMAFFAKADGALVFGQNRQKFGEIYSNGDFFPFDQSQSIMSPSLTVQAGFSYVPVSLPNLRFFTGFQYERFWSVGNARGSNGDVSDIGGFIGAMLRF